MVIGNGLGAAIRGLPVKVVACFLPATPIALIARPEVKSIQDLKGKTIGLNTFGGTLESLSRLIAKHFGLDPLRVHVSANPPHKRVDVDVDTRLALARLGAPQG